MSTTAPKKTATAVAPILNNSGAEHTVLAAIMQNGADFFIQVEGVLDANMFYSPQHQNLFSIFRHLVHNTAVKSFDVPIVQEAAKVLGHVDMIGKGRDEEYLASLSDVSTTPENALKHAVVVYKLAIARGACHCIKGVWQSMEKLTGDEKTSEILSMLEDPIFTFTGKVRTQGDTMTPIGEGFEARMKALAAQPKDMIGLTTGYAHYDFAIGGGLRNGTINIVGARPKGGKSFLCLNVAHHIAQSNVPVLYLDTELTREMQMDRLTAIVSGVEINRIESGKFGGDEDAAKAVYSAKQHIESLKLTHASIAGQSIKPVLSIIRRWLTKDVGFLGNGKAKPCCAVYDYIKLMDASDIKSNLAEFQLLGFLLTEMHNFALKYDIPVFAAVQLNRAGGDQEDGSVLAQSDRILWLCSSFAILKRKSPDEMNTDPKSNGDRKLVVTDTRFGAGMEPGDYMNLKTDLSRGRIVQGPMCYQGTSVIPHNEKVA